MINIKPTKSHPSNKKIFDELRKARTRNKTELIGLRHISIKLVDTIKIK